MKKRIYIKQWLALKPYKTQTLTDSYYLKLSNDIKKILTASDSLVLMAYLDKNEIDILSCFLTSYFEDIISETNIWNSFINYHTKLYKKKLPFYDTGEYYENEINEQDVSFLIWYFLNTIQGEKFISPYNDFIIYIASKVMLILEEEYEYAPENEYIKSFYQIKENENDFYKVRNFIDTVLFRTYLFFPDTNLRLQKQELEIIEDGGEDLLTYIQQNRDASVHENCTRLLSLKGKEWGAEIIEKEHPLSADLLNMSQKIEGYFFYKGQDEDDIFLEHIASGKRFELTKKSFDGYSELKKVNTIIYIGIVQWKNEWWFSGIYFQLDFNADLVLDEKNSLKSRMEVNFLDYNEEETIEMLQKQFNAFQSFNNGSPIAFVKSDKIHDFNKKFFEYYNNFLNLSEKEIEEAKNRVKKDGYFGNNNDKEFDFEETSEAALLFFNPNSGVEIALGINNAFPLKNNIFYNKNESMDDILHLLMSEEQSTELAKYCIDNCKKELPFFKEGIGKKYLNDIDFLLRFWKRENYYSKPLITFVGKKNEKLPPNILF